MKLYTSIGPNPRVVKMFLAEKGLEIPFVTVDLRGGENRQAPWTPAFDHMASRSGGLSESTNRRAASTP